ncbi:MAG TPA: hypothetical protein VMJ64_15725 [Anaerolineales bacterium]|nr:hypothetical protein [Anaerolineales bacterium]
MITSCNLNTKVPLKIDPEEKHAGLSSLFAAAVVSRSFCDMLLRDPEQALQQGYMGKDFCLSKADASLIVSLNARSLADLAQQVVQTLGQ